VLSISQIARFAARRQWARAGLQQPAYDRSEWERVARRIERRVGAAILTINEVAHLEQIRVAWVHGIGTCGGALGSLVLLAAGKTPEQRVQTFQHERAHIHCRELLPAGNEADIWGVTLALRPVLDWREEPSNEDAVLAALLLAAKEG